MALRCNLYLNLMSRNASTMTRPTISEIARIDLVDEASNIHRRNSKPTANKQQNNTCK